MRMSIGSCRLLGALAFVAACGSTDSNDADAGDSAPDAGSGRSDSGADRKGPAAQGAVSLHVAPSNVTTERCAAGAHWFNAPSPPANFQSQRVTEANVEEKAVDGVDGQRVACSVKSSGAKFAVSLDITTPFTDGEGRALDPSELHIDLPSIGPTDSAAPGTMQIRNNATTATAYSGNCKVSVTGSSAVSGLGVANGRIWASVVCERIAPSIADVGCGIDVGFLIFENCAQ